METETLDMNKTLHQKLLEVQAMNIPVPKNGINPHLKSKYRKLEDILTAFKPVLHSKGILVYVLNDALTSTLVMYDTITNETIKSTIRLPDTQDPQKIGGALTYYMRYNLSGLLGIEWEEDKDGEGKKDKPKEWTENRTRVVTVIKTKYGLKTNQEVQDKLSELKGEKVTLKEYTEAEAKNDLLTLNLL